MVEVAGLVDELVAFEFGWPGRGSRFAEHLAGWLTTTWGVEVMAGALPFTGHVSIMDRLDPWYRDLAPRLVTGVGPLTHSDGESYQVRFQDGGRAVYRPNLPDFMHAPQVPAYGTAPREIAAARLDRMLRFNLVPPTVPYTGHRGPGSLALWVPDASLVRPLSGYQRVDQERLAVLDYVMANLARGNGLGMRTADGRPVAVGNRYTFPQWEDSPISSSAVYRYLGRELGPEVMREVRTTSVEQVGMVLRGTNIAERAVFGAMQRLQEVRDRGGITGEAWSGAILDPP